MLMPRVPQHRIFAYLSIQDLARKAWLCYPYLQVHYGQSCVFWTFIAMQNDSEHINQAPATLVL